MDNIYESEITEYTYNLICLQLTFQNTIELEVL